MHQPIDERAEPEAAQAKAAEAWTPTWPPESGTPAEQANACAPTGGTAARKRGRPRKLSPEDMELIVGLVGAGCSRRYAARYVGCTSQTIINQMKRDPVFADKLRKAEVQRVTTPLRYLREQISRSWRANAWFLARMDREQFGRQLLEVTPWAEVEKLFKAWTMLNLDAIADEKTRQQMKTRAEQLVGEVKRWRRQY